MRKIGFLFDLDGVILDSEPQYDIFWGNQFLKAYPQNPELHRAIKGQTLTEIFNRFFPDVATQEQITRELNDYERNMPMPWVEGFPYFAREINSAGHLSCIVTSSNQPKMRSVYAQHPELRQLVSRQVTSEDFHESKPSPECYLMGMQRLGLEPARCIAFEDSVNGLKSAHAAGVRVVGLATSLTVEQIEDLHLADLIIPDFKKITVPELISALKMQ